MAFYAVRAVKGGTFAKVFASSLLTSQAMRLVVTRYIALHVVPYE